MEKVASVKSGKFNEKKSNIINYLLWKRWVKQEFSPNEVSALLWMRDKYSLNWIILSWLICIMLFRTEKICIWSWICLMEAIWDIIYACTENLMKKLPVSLNLIFIVFFRIFCCLSCCWSWVLSWKEYYSSWY